MPALPFIWLLPAACCLPLACSDFRRRRVAVVWLAALGVASFVAGAVGQGVQPTLLHTCFNALAAMLAIGITALWMSLRNLPLRRFFSRAFGAGDVAMLCALAPLFDPLGYVRLLVAACLPALAWWSVARKRRRTIPFAGMLALTLIGHAVFRFIRAWT